MLRANKNRITAFGETKSFSLWAEDKRCVVSAFLLKERVRKGWDPVEALTLPKGLQRPEKRLIERRWTQETEASRMDKAIKRVESGRLWLNYFMAANENILIANDLLGSDPLTREDCLKYGISWKHLNKLRKRVNKTMGKTKSQEELLLKDWLISKGLQPNKDFFTDYEVILSSPTEKTNKPERAYVDFAFPDQKIAISLEGVGGHTIISTYKKDIRTRNYLCSKGWRYFTLINSEVSAVLCNDFEHEREWMGTILNELIARRKE